MDAIKMNVGTVFQDPLRTGVAQDCLRDRRRKSDDTGSGSLSRADSSGDVLHDDAFSCREAEHGCSFLIGLGIGLTVHDVIGGDESPWQGQTGGFDANLGQRARARSDDGPAIGGKACEKVERAGERDHAFKVFDLAALNFAILGFVISVRKIFADGGETGTSVGGGYDFLGIESMFDRPLSPDAGDGGSGVDEDSVHIEKKGSAVKFGHLIYEVFCMKSVVATMSCEWGAPRC